MHIYPPHFWLSVYVLYSQITLIFINTHHIYKNHLGYTIGDYLQVGRSILITEKEMHQGLMHK